MSERLLARIGRALSSGGLSEVFRSRPTQVVTTPQTSYSEIHDHRSRRLVGYIPDEVFDSIVRRTPPTTWMTSEQSAAIKAHPQFITKAEADAVRVGDVGTTPEHENENAS